VRILCLTSTAHAFGAPGFSFARQRPCLDEASEADRMDLKKIAST
jgi:hypothetical protein